MSMDIESESKEESESKDEKKEEKEEKEEKKKMKIPKLKLEPLEPVTPIKIRRFSQPLIKPSFTQPNKNFVNPVSKYSNLNTNKIHKVNTATSNRPVSSFKKNLNKSYLDTIICESKVLMSIINEAKKKVYNKPISIFDKAKKNYKNHQRLKSAREHLRLNSNPLKNKRVRFCSMTYSENELHLFENINLNSSTRNKRNSIVFFAPNSFKNDSSRKISMNSNILNTNNTNSSKSKDNLNIIHEKHDEKHEDLSDKNSDSDNEKKISIDIFKNENMTQTNFVKKTNKNKIDKLSIEFSKAHNDKLLSFYGMKNYDNNIYRNNIKTEVKKNNEKSSKYNLRYAPQNKKQKRYRIDIEDSEEAKKKTKKFLKNIVELKTFISFCNTQPNSLRQDY